MDQSRKYSLLHYLTQAARAVDDLELSELKLPEKRTVGQNLSELIDTIETSVSHVNNFDNIPSPTEPEQGPEPTFEEQLEEAYEILKTESKPGPTLVSRTMGIKINDARKLYTNLIKSGRIVKGQRAVDIEQDGDESVKAPETETKKSTGKSKPTGPKAGQPKVMELISELPEGDDMLIPAHLQPLVVLPEGKRGAYLSGLKLDELITSEDIARGAVNGVNTILIDDIVELARSRRPKVKKEDAIRCVRDGSEREQKYFRIRSRLIKAIPNGKALYKHMASEGLSKRVLSDLQIIAKASANQQV